MGIQARSESVVHLRGAETTRRHSATTIPHDFDLPVVSRGEPRPIAIYPRGCFLHLSLGERKFLLCDARYGVDIFEILDRATGVTSHFGIRKGLNEVAIIPLGAKEATVKEVRSGVPYFDHTLRQFVIGNLSDSALLHPMTGEKITFSPHDSRNLPFPHSRDTYARLRRTIETTGLERYRIRPVPELLERHTCRPANFLSRSEDRKYFLHANADAGSEGPFDDVRAYYCIGYGQMQAAFFGRNGGSWTLVQPIEGGRLVAFPVRDVRMEGHGLTMEVERGKRRWSRNILTLPTEANGRFVPYSPFDGISEATPLWRPFSLPVVDCLHRSARTLTQFEPEIRAMVNGVHSQPEQERSNATRQLADYLSEIGLEPLAVSLLLGLSEEEPPTGLPINAAMTLSTAKEIARAIFKRWAAQNFEGSDCSVGYLANGWPTFHCKSAEAIERCGAFTHPENVHPIKV